MPSPIASTTPAMLRSFCPSPADSRHIGIPASPITIGT